MKKLPRSKCLFCGEECKRSTTKYCSCKCRSQHFVKLGLHYGGPVPKKYSDEEWEEKKKQKRVRNNNPKEEVSSPKRVYRVLEERECPSCHKLFFPNDHKHGQKFCTKHCMGLARTDEFAALGRSRKGGKMSLEARAKMSLSASKRPSNRNYTKGIGGIREDIGHYVRSSWEANVARILKFESIDYVYEPDVFKLTDEERVYHYIPDFKVKDRYIEVKGWWNEKALLIKKLMHEQYPNIQIEYISEPEYLLFTAYYPEFINGWEFKRDALKCRDN